MNNVVIIIIFCLLILTLIYNYIPNNIDLIVLIASFLGSLMAGLVVKALSEHGVI